MFRVVFSVLVLCLFAEASLADPSASMPAIAQVSIPDHHFNVTDYGAVGDGKTSNTDAIRKAIEACTAAGGGQVTFPAGTYLTGPIHLASNLDLHLEDGAIVQFSRNIDDYPLVIGNYEGKPAVVATSPITGENLHDIAFTGSGAFDGQGQVWRVLKRSKVSPQVWDEIVKGGGVVDAKGENWWPSQAAMNGFGTLAKLRAGHDEPKIEDYKNLRELLRPCLVMLDNCHNVLLENTTFRNSPAWNIHVMLSDNITVHHVTLDNPAYAQNGDGIDVDSCSGVQISDCTINAGDDDICLKSGRDEEGRKRGRPTENVRITNCKIGYGHGGITIGSEMSGGVRNVYVSNCTVDGAEAGLRFKSTRGRGGVVENIHVDHIRMANIQQAAIAFNMLYMVKKPVVEPLSERTPTFKNFFISDIECAGAKTALDLHGLEEMPLQNITLERVHITAGAAGNILQAKDVVLRDVQLKTSKPDELKIENVTNLSKDHFEQETQGTGQANTAS